MATELPRRLGLFSCVTVVAGTMIGSGIFLVPNLIARDLASPAVILAMWLFGGLLSLAGGLAFAELGAMMPQSGGQYAWIREAFGPMPAFLCGWMFFVIFLSASISWLGVAFSIYLSYFIPLEEWQRRAVGVAVIATLAYANYRGLRVGAFVQSLLAVLKISGMLLIVASAFVSPINHWASTPAVPPPALPALGSALIAILLTYDGWMTLGLLAGEVKNPERNLPRGIFLGIGLCMALYLVINFAYLKVLTVPETAAAERVAAQAATLTMGPIGGKLIALVILCSILGSMNGWMMAAPRTYYAQARDGLFFRRFAEVHPRYLTPSFSIVAQAIWAILLVVSGTYRSLATFAMFSGWIGYTVAAIGLFVLRRNQPDLPRPYRMFGYPWMLLAFIAVASGFVLNTLYTDPVPSCIGLALILAGIPAYRWFAMR